MKLSLLLMPLLCGPGCLPASESPAPRRVVNQDVGQGVQVPTGSPTKPSPPASGGVVSWGISFPPVADAEQVEITRKHLRDLGVTRIRFSEHWSLREPQKGKYNWAPLDWRMRFVEEEGLSLMLTIESNGPEWACGKPANDQSCVFSDLDAFRAYVRALLTRYQGKIDKIQFGNEWQTTYWYAGGARDFVAANNVVYEEAKRISPDTKVVLGGFSIGALHVLGAREGRVDRFHQADGTLISGERLKEMMNSKELHSGIERIRDVCTRAKYDIVDLHLYDDSENWAAYVEVAKALVKKPIVVSEFGGPHQLVERYTDAYHAECVGRYMETLSAIGVQEAYYFKLVESNSAQKHHVKSSLLDRNGKVKPAYAVFRGFSRAAQD